MEMTIWGLVGHTCSHSLVHSDAQGLSTYVKIITGEKLWFVGYRQEPATSTSDILKWECTLLKKGDELIMPPGTLHFVITTKDCFAVGGHFYNMGCMPLTMEALVTEHFFGNEWTNTEHPTVPIILFKLLDDICHRLDTVEAGVKLNNGETQLI